MEGHPPDLLPEGAIPSGLPLPTSSLRGVRRRSNLGWGVNARRFVSNEARTIPLAPFLKGRGNKKKCWRDTLQTSCQRGRSPLDAPCGLADSPRPPARGGDPLWTPLVGWRTPQTSCQRGRSPLDAPCGLADTPDLLPEGAIPSGRPLWAGGHPRPLAYHAGLFRWACYYRVTQRNGGAPCLTAATTGWP